jgi:hypothetical protein
MKFTRLKVVTLPLFKLADNKAMYLKILGPFTIGKQIDDKKEAATLAHVINLETGEEGQIIVGAVLKSTLHEAYAGDSYVGKCFEIVKSKDGDKKYNNYTVNEVSEPEDDEEAAETGTTEVEVLPKSAKAATRRR